MNKTNTCFSRLLAKWHVWVSNLGSKNEVPATRATIPCAVYWYKLPLCCGWSQRKRDLKPLWGSRWGSVKISLLRKNPLFFLFPMNHTDTVRPLITETLFLCVTRQQSLHNVVYECSEARWHILTSHLTMSNIRRLKFGNQKLPASKFCFKMLLTSRRYCMRCQKLARACKTWDFDAR